MAVLNKTGDTVILAQSRGGYLALVDSLSLRCHELIKVGTWAGDVKECTLRMSGWMLWWYDFKASLPLRSYPKTSVLKASASTDEATCSWSLVMTGQYACLRCIGSHPREAKAVTSKKWLKNFPN